MNLDAAGNAIPDLDLICFTGDEHVLGLTGIIEPNWYEPAFMGGRITIVANHDELAKHLANSLAAGSRQLRDIRYA